MLKSEVDLAALPAEAPPAVRRLLRRCLERDPRNRLHDVADGRLEPSEGPRAAAGDLPTRDAGPSRWRPIAAGAALLVVGGLVGVATRGQSRSSTIATSIPWSWVARIRRSMAALTPRFSANRTVRQYAEEQYIPAAAAYAARAFGGANALIAWQAEIARHLALDVEVYLGGVDPSAVRVELYAEPRQGRLGSSARCVASRRQPPSTEPTGLRLVYRPGAPQPTSRHGSDRTMRWRWARKSTGSSGRGERRERAPGQDDDYRPGGRGRNASLSILRRRMRDSSVLGGTPSACAAPPRP